MDAISAIHNSCHNPCPRRDSNTRLPGLRILDVRGLCHPTRRGNGISESELPPDSVSEMINRKSPPPIPHQLPSTGGKSRIRGDAEQLNPSQKHTRWIPRGRSGTTAPPLKTGRAQALVGSNPTPSAPDVASRDLRAAQNAALSSTPLSTWSYRRGTVRWPFSRRIRARRCVATEVCQVSPRARPSIASAAALP